MKYVDEILISGDIFLDCPYCGHEEYGFPFDPRGIEYECDQCHKKYKVKNKASVQIN